MYIGAANPANRPPFRYASYAVRKLATPPRFLDNAIIRPGPEFLEITVSDFPAFVRAAHPMSRAPANLAYRKVVSVSLSGPLGGAAI